MRGQKCASISTCDAILEPLAIAAYSAIARGFTISLNPRFRTTSRKSSTVSPTLVLACNLTSQYENSAANAKTGGACAPPVITHHRHTAPNPALQSATRQVAPFLAQTRVAQIAPPEVYTPRFRTLCYLPQIRIAYAALTSHRPHISKQTAPPLHPILAARIAAAPRALDALSPLCYHAVSPNAHAVANGDDTLADNCG